ncbi:SRPBCC family protein [Streptomyces sp. MST-110588]|uniref:SRPBCC family protein n=1 Tax=Streptomyces sp. MST-110588 TaxID=2833628 RepID=UPI001F5D4BCF|nr:SRPBCC family protein [Streptomyces sp. MST-110588]UNO38896.1 SRPBCC family protein [Streptomyces sp. MST-110588]
MMRQLRPVDLDFLDSAPLRLVFAAEVAASPEEMYVALAKDVAGWSHWFTGVSRAVATDGGAARDVRLKGGTRLRETVMVAERDRRYTYRVDAVGVPGPHALMEDWRLIPAGGGTRVRWMFATDGPGAYRFAVTLARPALGRTFRASMRALDRRLAPV